MTSAEPPCAAAMLVDTARAGPRAVQPVVCSAPTVAFKSLQDHTYNGRSRQEVLEGAQFMGHQERHRPTRDQAQVKNKLEGIKSTMEDQGIFDPNNHMTGMEYPLTNTTTGVGLH